MTGAWQRIADRFASRVTVRPSGDAGHDGRVARALVSCDRVAMLAVAIARWDCDAFIAVRFWG